MRPTPWPELGAVEEEVTLRDAVCRTVSWSPRAASVRSNASLSTRAAEGVATTTAVARYVTGWAVADTP